MMFTDNLTVDTDNCCWFGYLLIFSDIYSRLLMTIIHEASHVLQTKSKVLRKSAK